jgi:phage gp46-like protein
MTRLEHEIYVKLEGRVAGQWADELRHIILGTDLRNMDLHVDVSDVTSADRNGEEALRWIARIGGHFHGQTACGKWLCEGLGIPLNK